MGFKEVRKDDLLGSNVVHTFVIGKGQTERPRATLD